MNAQEQVAEAIATHGRPMWVAHIPKRIVQEVDKNILKENQVLSVEVYVIVCQKVCAWRDVLVVIVSQFAT